MFKSKINNRNTVFIKKIIIRRRNFFRIRNAVFIIKRITVCICYLHHR